MLFLGLTFQKKAFISRFLKFFRADGFFPGFTRRGLLKVQERLKWRPVLWVNGQSTMTLANGTLECSSPLSPPFMSCLELHRVTLCLYCSLFFFFFHPLHIFHFLLFFLTGNGAYEGSDPNISSLEMKRWVTNETIRPSLPCCSLCVKLRIKFTSSTPLVLLFPYRFLYVFYHRKHKISV